jgi:hypothetical protein
MDPIKKTYQFLDERELVKFEGWKPRPMRFNPSSISQCSRRLAYSNNGTEPDGPMAGFLSQYGPAGDFYHDQVRKEMRAAGCEMYGLKLRKDGTIEETDIVKTQFEHNGELITISGRGDGRIKIDGVMHYLEGKSVDAFKYRWMEEYYQKGYKDFDPGPESLVAYIKEKYPNFVEQCNMMMAPEMLYLPAAYVVVINRSNCQFGFANKDYTEREGGIILPFDPELWERQKNKMAFIAKSVREGTLPVQEETEGSKACGQCPFEKRCWG